MFVIRLRPPIVTPLRKEFRMYEWNINKQYIKPSRGPRIEQSGRNSCNSPTLMMATARAAGGSPIIKAVALISGDPNVKGSLQFVQDANGATHVVGRISGLSPGLHGFHIHAFGDTTNGCISTGSHFNPLRKNHGGPTDEERHAGDLGNIVAGQDGIAEFRLMDTQIPLTGPHSILGRAVVVHADPDDLGRGGHELSKTTGNAGGRVGCGIIGLQSTV